MYCLCLLCLICCVDCWYCWFFARLLELLLYVVVFADLCSGAMSICVCWVACC